MVVCDDVLDAVQTALFEADQEILPGRVALAVGELDRETLPPVFPVDAERDERRTARPAAC